MAGADQTMPSSFPSEMDGQVFTEHPVQQVVTMTGLHEHRSTLSVYANPAVGASFPEPGTDHLSAFLEGTGLEQNSDADEQKFELFRKETEILRTDWLDEKNKREACERKLEALVEMVDVLHDGFGQMVQGLLDKRQHVWNASGYFLMVGPFNDSAFVKLLALLEGLPAQLMGRDENLEVTKTRLNKINALLKGNKDTAPQPGDGQNDRQEEPAVVPSTSQGIVLSPDIQEFIEPQFPAPANPVPKRGGPPKHRQRTFDKKAKLPIRKRLQTKKTKSYRCLACSKLYIYYANYAKHLAVCSSSQGVGQEGNPTPPLATRVVEEGVNGGSNHPSTPSTNTSSVNKTICDTTYMYTT